MRHYPRNIAIALAATVCALTPLAAQNAATQVDPKFMEQLRAALDKEPELVLKAAQAAQQRQRDGQLAAQNAKVANVRPTLLSATNFGPVIGNPKGTIVTAELLDYACPFCKRAHTLVDGIAAANKDVRFVIVMRPVLGPQSETLARFALAASLQGRFPQAHDALYEKFGDDHQTPATDDNLRAVALTAGVDFERAKKDMTGDAVVALLNKHQQLAEQIGVNGTPFFVTSKTVIPGAPQSEAQLKDAMGL